MRKTTGKALLGMLFLLVAMGITASPVMAEPEYGITYTPETVYVSDTVLFEVPIPDKPLWTLIGVKWDFGDGTVYEWHPSYWRVKIQPMGWFPHVYETVGTFVVVFTFHFAIWEPYWIIYTVTVNVLPPVPRVEDTEAYIKYVNETVQDLPVSCEVFNVPAEDVVEDATDIKYDFSDKFADIEENINEGNYARAIEHLEEIKAFADAQIKDPEKQEIINMVDALIAYLETL